MTDSNERHDSDSSDKPLHVDIKGSDTDVKKEDASQDNNVKTEAEHKDKANDDKKFDMSASAGVINSSPLSSPKSPLVPLNPLDHNVKHKLMLIKTQVLQKLKKMKGSVYFRVPVDAKALGIYPIYYQVIKHPSDLGTVIKKIEKNQYRSREDCLVEIDRIWTNAMTFNAPGHVVHEAAKKMQKCAEERLQQLEKEEEEGMWSAEKLAEATKAKQKIVQTVAAESRKNQRSVARKVSYSGFDDDTEEFDVSVSKTTPIAPSLTFKKNKSLNTSSAKTKKSSVSANSNNMCTDVCGNTISRPLQHCHALILKLMNDPEHKSYVEPFRDLPEDLTEDVMCLDRISWRIESSYYNHPLQVANDVRRIAHQAFRCPMSKSASGEESDPPKLIRQAANMLHAFELGFSTIEFRVPNLDVEDAQSYDLNVRQLDNNSLDHSLRVMQNIQEEMNMTSCAISLLMKDLSAIRRAEKSGLLTADGGKGSKAKRTSTSPRKRNISSASSSVGGGGGTPNKKSKTTTSSSKSVGGSSSSNSINNNNKSNKQREPNTLTHDQSLVLRQQVSQLDEDQQQEIVHIMLNNQETLTTDANGYTEIDLGICSAKTVREVQTYIASLTSSKQQSSTSSSAGGGKVMNNKKGGGSSKSGGKCGSGSKSQKSGGGANKKKNKKVIESSAESDINISSGESEVSSS